jgi:YD repeat-containing protein
LREHRFDDPIVTTMSYDTLGRKTLTNDPDAGLRYQDYNAAGDQECWLRHQTDPL